MQVGTERGGIWDILKMRKTQKIKTHNKGLEKKPKELNKLYIYIG